MRKGALGAVQEDRGQGELSKKFEYKAAKQCKNENEKRIRYLERMIKNAVVISDQSKSDEVGMNNKVTLYFEDDEEEEEYTIVTTVRANSLHRWISNEWTREKAGRGRRVGDLVFVKVGEDGGYYVEIRGIENTGDDGSIGLRKF